MSVLNENTIIGASAAGEYEIEQSLRFNDDDSSYLSRTPASASNQKTWTWSAWVKASNSGTDQTLFTAEDGSDNASTMIVLKAAGQLQVWQNGNKPFLRTNEVHRDPSSWWHIVVALDTTQSTAANRLKVYVNGSVITSFSTETYPDQNQQPYINAATRHDIGNKNYLGSDSQYFNGYMGEINFIDGQALTPDSFGETGDYGEWKPTKYAGTYGTNGFYLDFKSSGSLGNDAAGSNNWTPNNLAATDQMVDSPTNNFATLNPLFNSPLLIQDNSTGSLNTLAEGNLKSTTTGAIASVGSVGTFSLSSGKYYFEYTATAVSPSGNSVGLDRLITTNEQYWYRSTGSIVGDSTTGSPSTWTVGDIIGVAANLDTGVITFYKNNVSQGTSSITTSKLSSGFMPMVWYRDNTNTPSSVMNFGADSSFAGNKTPQGNQDANGIGDFYYAPPAGFLALCTQNLPDATVIPSEHFNTVLWSGNGSASRSITGVGFEPSMLWAKSRTSASNHNLIDAVRGVDVRLLPASTLAEIDSAFFASLDSDGFSLDNANDNDVNQSGQTYVAWNWKAGGAASSNTNGTITSSVSANPSAGFSIVSYTGTGANGATVGHGLSVAPELIINKKRNASQSWYVWHEALASTSHGLSLDTTAAQGAFSYGTWGTKTSTIMTASQGANGLTNVNATGDTYISYAFHSVDGYSKVGSYTGNGSATDGTFVHCGFRPAFVMVKRTNAAQDWTLFDNTRNPANATNLYLHPNSSAADGSGIGDGIDLVSNGFKMRHQANVTNNSGSPYVFLAFAESPFKHSNAR